jgi:4-amino-4-deoxy-L-arabinose transferase-like glycosyltransferase
LIGAIGAVLLTYWTALAFVSRRAAVMAGLMMATSILLGFEARIAKTDAMLLLTVMAVMGAMARVYLAQARTTSQTAMSKWALPAIFWTALAGGILLKGPVIVLFVGLPLVTLAVVDRSLRWIKALQPIPGVILAMVLVLPWFIAILNRAGAAFVADSVGQDMLSKVFSGQESHGAPPGYYFVLFFVAFWPGATLAGLCVPAIWSSRHEKGARFLIAWIVPAWIVFELVATKLPHYVLPLYPAIAILIAGVVDRHVLAPQRWMTRGTAWWFALPTIVGLLGLGLLLFVGRQFGLLAWPLVTGAAIMGLFAWQLYDIEGAERSLARAMAASLLLSMATYGVTIPSLRSAFPSEQLARELRAAACDDRLVAVAGYEEPSLIFLLGTQTRLVDGAHAADFLAVGGCRFALVEAQQQRGFVRRADAIGLRYALGARVDGFNLSNGRRISVAVYRSEVSR